MKKPKELISEIWDNSKVNMLGDYTVKEILPLLDYIDYLEDRLEELKENDSD